MTETARIIDLQTARLVIEKFRGEGVQILLDDFGSGYSSLQLLRDLRLDKVKIDKTFIQSMLTDRSHRTIDRFLLA
ncbi:EAL domain-containing protein [Paraburkholderia fungorum]|uniref:EAL domain-containing protein n=1 Tax=Paraburkholderia fungorum TaxID=134537 RepID=UPI0038BA2DAE